MRQTTVIKYYYKVHQVLQSVSGITKSDRLLLKGRQVLQSVTDCY